MQERTTYCLPLSILVAVANATVVSTEVATGTDVTKVCPSETVVEAEKIVWISVNVTAWPSDKALSALATRGSMLVVTGRSAPRTL
jgi:hypothetical protein